MAISGGPVFLLCLPGIEAQGFTKQVLNTWISWENMGKVAEHIGQLG
jgi:hypothetical protein